MITDTPTLKSYLSAESTVTEFKEELNFSHKAKQWLKTVSAFANTKGGVIVVGVADDKRLVGVSDIQNLAAKTAETINARIEPIPVYELRPILEDGKYFLIISVSEGMVTPYYYVSNGMRTAYIRSGDESIEAPVHILNALILKGQHTSYDALPSPYLLSQVSFTYLSAEFQRILHLPPLTENDLISFGLLLEDRHITYGGALLCDQYILRHSRIFCTRWKYLEKGHVGDDALDDKEYEGNILQILNNAELFIINNSKRSWGVYDRRTHTSEDYPHVAVHEALVNAVIHRDYFDISSEIHVDMYPDRVEIVSPGGMVDGSVIQDRNLLTVPSKRRNLVISDIFGRLNLMDRRGSGFKRILDEYVAEKVKPRFYSDTSCFTVVLPNTSYGLRNDIYQPVPAGDIPQSESVYLTDREEMVLNILRQNPQCSVAELTAVMQLNAHQVRYVVDRLKKKGVLKRSGSRKTGCWEILTD